MSKNLNLLKRIITFFIGMTIIQFGVALYVKTNIGSDPFTVFTKGLSILFLDLWQRFFYQNFHDCIL